MGLSVAFFGTPEAAVPALKALIRSSHRMAGVVTAPDRARGRGMEVGPSPVKELAQRGGVGPIVQPGTLRDESVHREFEGLGADLFVVVAFGLILPKEVLALPRLGCVNVHFSLLPKLRGAAPVQWALIEGHTLTGVTTIQMDEGIDTGPIIGHIEEPILEADTGETLERRLASKGAELLLETLSALEDGRVDPVSQNDAAATYASKLGPDDARIEWRSGAEEIERRVRAFDPRPGAWTTYRGRRLKLWKVSISGDVSNGEVGTLDVAKDRLLVDTSTTRLSLDLVHPEGGSRMTAAEYIRGHRPASGDRLE